MSTEVKIENGTKSSTLRLFRRTGSHMIPLKTLCPLSENPQSSSYMLPYQDGTNVFVHVEYELETENQGNGKAKLRQRTYKDAGVRIDSTILRENSGIIVVDSEAAQGSSDEKKFELRLTPRAVKYEQGWLVTLVTTIFSRLKYYVYSESRNRISATQPPVPTAEPPANATEPLTDPPANATEPLTNPPANATEPLSEPPPEPPSEAPAIAAGHPVDVTDAGWGQWVPLPVSSAFNYIGGFWTHSYSKNPNESMLPISSRDANFSV